MSHFKAYQLFTFLLLLVFFLTITSLCQAPATHSQSTTTKAALNQKDSIAGSRIASVEEMAKRVDSLQFIVVYNAELLRRDLDSKMMLIYVMLGVTVIACVLMYILLSQSQRQRKELEEKIIMQLAASAADLDAKIKVIQAGLSPPMKTPAKKAPPKKRGK